MLRQLVMERLIQLDCEAQTPLADITRAVTELAELALDVDGDSYAPQLGPDWRETSREPLTSASGVSAGTCSLNEPSGSTGA